MLAPVQGGQTPERLLLRQMKAMEPTYGFRLQEPCSRMWMLIISTITALLTPSSKALSVFSMRLRVLSSLEWIVMLLAD